MKSLGILQELWKCDRDMKWANAVGKITLIDTWHEPSICRKYSICEACWDNFCVYTKSMSDSWITVKKKFVYLECVIRTTVR